MPENSVVEVLLVSLLLTLNIFYTFLYCFYCWLWTVKCLLGRTMFNIFHCWLWTNYYDLHIFPLHFKGNFKIDVIDIVLVSWLLTLNIFLTFFQCLYCWIWTGKCLLERLQRPSKKVGSLEEINPVRLFSWSFRLLRVHNVTFFLIWTDMINIFSRFTFF